MNRERERPIVGVGGGLIRLGVDVCFFFGLGGCTCLFVCLMYIDTCQFLILVCFLSRLLCFLI